MAVIVMKKKGFPLFTKNDIVDQNGDLFYAQDLVKNSFAVKRMAYEAKNPEDRRAFELDRWVDLSAKKAMLAKPADNDHSQQYKLATMLPHSYETLDEPVAHEALSGEDFLVGKPYIISVVNGMTFANHCDAVDTAIRQAEALCSKENKPT